MSQPGIPASGGASTGLQAQNGAASASGSPYTNGKYLWVLRVGEGEVWAPARVDLWLLPPSEGTAGESDFPARVRSAWSWEAEPQGPRLVLVFHVYLFILSFSTQLLSTCCIKRPGYTWVKNTDSVCTSQLACKALGICLCALSLRATSPSPSGEHGLGSDSFRSGRACIKYSV